MLLERPDLRVDGDDFQQPVPLHRLEVEAPAAGVAEQLLLPLLVSEDQAALAQTDAGRHERRHQQRITRAGGSGDQHHRVTEEAAVDHRVELGVADADPLVAQHAVVLDVQMGDHVEAGVVDREAELAGPVPRAAELHDLDGAATLLGGEHVP